MITGQPANPIDRIFWNGRSGDDEVIDDSVVPPRMNQDDQWDVPGAALGAMQRCGVVRFEHFRIRVDSP